MTRQRPAPPRRSQCIGLLDLAEFDRRPLEQQPLSAAPALLGGNELDICLVLYAVQEAVVDWSRQWHNVLINLDPHAYATRPA